MERLLSIARHEGRDVTKRTRELTRAGTSRPLSAPAYPGALNGLLVGLSSARHLRDIT